LVVPLTQLQLEISRFTHVVVKVMLEAERLRSSRELYDSQEISSSVPGL
jgi:hypothetical protein